MWEKKSRQDSARGARKQVRVDDGHPARKSGRGASDGGVLEQFRTKAPTAARERRKTPRFEAGSNRVWLGWWGNEKGFVATAARIVNISLGGALLAPENPPPQDRPCWLCLGIPDPVDFVEVGVLDIVASRNGQYAVRLSFREPCPYSFFRAVIDGIDISKSIEPPVNPPIKATEDCENPVE